MISSGVTRIKRQSAIKLFAQEFAEANLTEQGIGEYDPSFVITKLGIKVNRALVCGVIERLERREGDNGPSFSGTLRDPTGEHRFNVAPFQTELQLDIEELHARFESGDRFLMALVGKSRWFEGDEGGIFTSFRAEEFAVIDQDTYMHWLIDTSDATMRRLKYHEISLGVEVNLDSMQESNIPQDLIEGTIMAKQHYPDFDPETYRLGVLKALSSALGRSTGDLIEKSEISNADIKITPLSSSNPAEVILETIRKLDSGAGVEYDSLVEACVLAGISRESAEDSIEDLRDVDGEIIEPRFGFFRILSE
tara:strand:- start:175 stop:1098 length:924 start_codon:yes stop_codon:yes gene_type:complete